MADELRALLLEALEVGGVTADRAWRMRVARAVDARGEGAQRTDHPLPFAGGGTIVVDGPPDPLPNTFGASTSGEPVRGAEGEPANGPLVSAVLRFWKLLERVDFRVEYADALSDVIGAAQLEERGKRLETAEARRLVLIEGLLREQADDLDEQATVNEEGFSYRAGNNLFNGGAANVQREMAKWIREVVLAPTDEKSTELKEESE